MALDQNNPKDWALFCKNMTRNALDAFRSLTPGGPNRRPGPPARGRIFRASWALTQTGPKAWLYLFRKRSVVYVQHVDGSSSPYPLVLEDAWAIDWQTGEVPTRGRA